MPSHTQVLATQRWPGAHAPALPHRQLPPAEQLSARSSQTAQVAPPAPQVSSDRARQAAPWQQPLGHDVASQTHCPELQRWPPAQADPAPHAQVPSAPQWSARLASHAAHAPPPLPHATSDGVWQLAPWQQPAPQEEASHTQAPFAHRCPDWQAGPPPQRQVPITAQVSALAVSQIAHAAAPVPQVLTERG